jgi:purine-binding chemotaxis protein CheW
MVPSLRGMADVATQAAGADLLKLVCFELQGQEYGADITEVKETIPVRPITRVFLTPVWLSGIINLRGDVVAILDLAQLLGLDATQITDDSRILIARVNNVVAGVLVDRLAEVRSLPTAGVRPPPPTLAADAAALLRGIVNIDGGAAVRILDLQALFESERLRAFQRRV